MDIVFVLHHGDAEDAKLIGVYRSRERAEMAATRLRDQPGFRDDPAAFVIDEYPLDKDHGAEGFLSMPS